VLKHRIKHSLADAPGISIFVLTIQTKTIGNKYELSFDGDILVFSCFLQTDRYW